MLRIFVVSHNGSPPASPVFAVFGNGEGSIGRDETNTLVLAEYDKHLSRVQALVKGLGGEYFLLDQGGNPSIVNGTPIGKGKVAALKPGDRIKMAGWLLQVAPVAPVASATATVPPVPSQERQPLPLPDFFSGHKSGQSPRRPSQADGDERDMGTETVLMPGFGEEEEEPPSWGNPSAFLSDFLQEDILTDVIEEGEPRGQAPESSVSPDVSALQEALLRGMGIREAGDWRLTPERAELVGAMLRECLDGFQRLLKQNALGRKSYGAEADEGDGRNPVRHSADASQALLRLLASAPGDEVMAPVEAVDDAILELHAHQAGFSLGVRGAVAGMLTGFRPEILEKRLTVGLGPGEIEEKMWALYVQHHPEIVRKAENVFQTTLIKAYRRVYEDQKKRPVVGRKTSGSE